MSGPAFVSQAPAPNRDHDAARRALVALIDAGVSPDDARCQTLITLLQATAPPRVARPARPPLTRPANAHNGLPRALAPVGARLPASPSRAFAEENQRAIVAARLVMEDAFTDAPQDFRPEYPAAPRKDAMVSLFQAAAAIAPEKAPRKSGGKRKDPSASPGLSARNVTSPKASRGASKGGVDIPDFSFQLAGNVSMEHAFQIKAQVEAYRRLIRGADIPLEVQVAARGRPGKELRALPGPVVERGTARGDEDDFSYRPSIQPGRLQQFDVRQLPRFPIDHVFSAEDVVGNGEKIADEQVAERIRLVQTHHERLHARYIRELRFAGKGPGDFTPRLDPRVAQQQADLIASVKTETTESLNGKEEPRAHSSLARSEGRNASRREAIVQDKGGASVVRDRASVPITVATNNQVLTPFTALASERQKRIAGRVQARQQELAELPPTLPDEVKRRALIEAKELKLIGLQRTLRAKVRNTMQRVLRRTGISDLRLHVSGRFKRRNHSFAYSGGMGPGGRLLGQKANVNHRVEQEARRRARRMHMMNGLLTHAQEFRSSSHARSVLHKRLLKDLERYFRDRSREEERRRKKEQMERLRALRSNNEDEYLELLKTTKNKRLIQLLKQTDEYLMQIGAQVERQKQAVRDDDEGKETKAGSSKADLQAHDESEHPEPNAQRDGEDELQQLKKRRNDYYTITHTISEKVYQPESLVGGTLKGYQLEGLEWLVSLFNNNLNGILADEMGLGKTIQTLSLITYLVEVKRVTGPFLVIVPLSVMSNWVRELDLWAPSLTKVVYRGDPATRKNIQMYEMAGGSYNVLLTTYEFIVKDKNVLGKIRWKYIIMDEGHRMKNADCKLALTLGAKYSSRNRLLLTGTPLQNNMTELWALLNFLLPSIFSSAETFETWFNAPFQASSLSESAELNEEENLLIISRLHQVLRPFMLRRLKTDVEAQLPDKVEIVFRCEMSVWQRVLYRQMRSKVGIAVGSGGSGGMGFRSFNNIVMQLKKVCNHPFLFYSEDELMSIPQDYLMRASGKFELLEHCLRKLKRSGHRVLMFSQMTAALDYLEYFLSTIGMKHLRLDGTTKADDRQEMLEMFNAENSEFFCFLLSTRAGGLGLNLQTADTVIIFDSDWNPMMDLQAQDRAHRIGQTKEVRVFRLICSGSIEVKILERANRKLQIDAQVIQAGQFNNKSSDNDRQEMLKDLLRQQGGDDMATNLDVTPLTEINRQLARSEEEFELFEEMDAESAVEREGKPRLLINEEDLPSWVLKPEIEEKQKQQDPIGNILEHGRGRRKRKEVLYDDNLTEREWTAAMEEEGDIKEAIKRKRRRLTAMNPIVESSSGDENETQRESEKFSLEQDSEPDKKDDLKLDNSEDAADEDSKSDAHQKSSVQKLEPFVDPELHRVPRPRRKRGRPRKGRDRI